MKSLNKKRIEAKWLWFFAYLPLWIIVNPLVAKENEVALSFIQSARLVEEAHLPHFPKVISGNEQRRHLFADDLILVDKELPNQRWGIFHQTGTQQRKGNYPAIVSLELVAMAELNATGDGMSELKLSDQRQEITRNDVVLPLDNDEAILFSASFSANAASLDNDITLLATLEHSNYAIVNQVVIVGGGIMDGIQQGDVFAIYENSTLAWNHINIDKHGSRVGCLMITRAYSYYSLAVMIKSRIPIRLPVKLISPSINNEYGERWCF